MNDDSNNDDNNSNKNNKNNSMIHDSNFNLNSFMIISHAEEMNPSKRTTMEDKCIILPAGTWDDMNLYDPNISYVGVYDGHGGREIVDFLDYAMTYHIAQELKHDDDDDDEVVKEEQQQQQQRGNNDTATTATTTSSSSYSNSGCSCSSMEQKLVRAFLMADVNSRLAGLWTSGATVAVCLIKRDHKNPNRIEITTANVGDSRIVLGKKKKTRHVVNNNNNNSASSSHITTTHSTSTKTTIASDNNNNNSLFVERLTYDHRVDDPHEIARIQQAGGFLFRGRVVGVLAVTRSIGDHILKEFVIAHPHVCERTIQYFNMPSSSSSSSNNDDNNINRKNNQEDDNDDYDEIYFLIIACDGFWDVFTDQNAVEIVNAYTGPKQQIAHYLVQQAIQRGTTDNVTVVVVWLLPASSPSDTT